MNKLPCSVGCSDRGDCCRKDETMNDYNNMTNCKYFGLPVDVPETIDCNDCLDNVKCEDEAEKKANRKIIKIASNALLATQAIIKVNEI